MKVAGIDLSGPRNIADTCMAIFDGRAGELQFLESHDSIHDSQILEIIVSFGKEERIIIGIDAPLSYNALGGDRVSDRELRQVVKQRSRVVGIIAPMAPQMSFLTLHGISLTRMLESSELKTGMKIVEVHPGACMLLRGAPKEDVEGFKKDASARVRLRNWLGTQGLTGLTSTATCTDHWVAACAAALGAWKWGSGKTIWRHPAEPPSHPYDFAC